LIWQRAPDKIAKAVGKKSAAIGSDAAAAMCLYLGSVFRLALCLI